MYTVKQQINTGFSLPPLPFRYEELEPFIDKDTLLNWKAAGELYKAS